MGGISGHNGRNVANRIPPKSHGIWVRIDSLPFPSAIRLELFREEVEKQACFSHAGVAQLVEHNVANVVVVGSNPITRSGRFGFSLTDA